jgi:hypothetical protein
MSKNTVNITIFCAFTATGTGPQIDLVKLIKIFLLTIGVTLVVSSISSCKKAVAIDEPVNSITTSKTFSTDANAKAAVSAIYSYMINTDVNIGFGSGAVTIYAGLASDELVYSSTNQTIVDFNKNTLLPDNQFVNARLWSPLFFVVYQSNACLEGLTASSTLTESVKEQLLGEVKFLRAFSYFYLVNLFGDVPLMTSTAWESNYKLANTPASRIYEQIISDLESAREVLAADYALFQNERVRVTKSAASALLARAYLFNKDYAKAETEASVVIANSLYGLETDLTKVFLKNSKEAILQLKPSPAFSPYTVVEATLIIPNSPTRRADYALTSRILDTFQIGDKRKISWISQSVNGGITYNYPAKYKVKVGTAGTDASEYYTLLRLGEQYLIRAEARLRSNNPDGAIGDLNVVRARAGLTDLPFGLSESIIKVAIERERMTELFAEWGHRWLDLKRWSVADAALSTMKAPGWQTTDQLFPIPSIEILRAPNLKQNDGYQ